MCIEFCRGVPWLFLLLNIVTKMPRDQSSELSPILADHWDHQYGSGPSEACTPSATHDISRVNYHIKHLDTFVQTLEDVSLCCSVAADWGFLTKLAIVLQQGVPESRTVLTTVHKGSRIITPLEKR